MQNVVNLSDVNLSHVNVVGGKNASTGEMIQHLSTAGVKVPTGFATTVDAYQHFLKQNQLDKKIIQLLKKTKVKNIDHLNKTSLQIQRWVVETAFLPDFIQEVTRFYLDLKNPTVAVRSSATTEDLDMASFAGAQETYLNVKGLQNILQAIKLVYSSLYTSRAIAYRFDNGLDHLACSLSVGIQPMIRSDKGASGVIFTIDTESGFDKVLVINASYGLGEAIVKGKVNPDEFILYKPAIEENKFAILQRNLGEKALKMVYDRHQKAKHSIKEMTVPLSERQKFCINDKDIQLLAKQSLQIENHYGKPMDIEWAKDGVNGHIYILQARPETVKSRLHQENIIELYTLDKKGKTLVQGQSIGQGIGCGKARVILDIKKMRGIEPGQVLVTDMTDPDWEPIMKLASGIITNRGGRTCHAAIIARELGIPAIVGCGDATTKIKNLENVTVSCAEGQDGFVYAGILPYQHKKMSVKNIPALPFKMCMNLGNPEKAFASQFLPNEGVGLARIEFIISNRIGVHPNAALNFDKLPAALKKQIKLKISGYPNAVEFYIEKLREGIATIAAAFYPKEVIYRFSDFKSNEYANLLGGHLYEPQEENPMIGFRGASRYNAVQFRKAFELECKAFVRVREAMGLLNAQLMIPFVRTVKELQDVITTIEKAGLKRGEKGLKIYMMCEIPSNVLLASEFLKYVDGFSIGSNDLTQLTLGLDRDSSLVAGLFDERNEAVKILLRQAIKACKKQGKYIGICGQGPSDYPDFAEWLMQEGIDCMSLNPDTIVKTWLYLAKSHAGHSNTES